MSRRLRCLLLSPVAPPDPDNGDAQYTRDLLADPPASVEYVPYTQALACGELAWGPSFRSGGVRRPADALAAAARAALHAVRRAGVLLPDPVRWVRVLGDFDLVHVHCMPVRFLGPAPPLVVSDSAGTWWYWTAGRHLSERRVARMLARERRAARALGYLHPSVRPDGADRVLLFVEAGRRLLERFGALDEATVCAPGVPAPVRERASDGRTLLFVARHFRAKGGTLALEAFRRVRRRFPDARLLVAGTSDPDPGLEGVVWLGPRSRAELYADVYPRADVFLYPTTFDCAPLVVMEALAHGLAVVVPRAFALPELVRDRTTGVLVPPGDAAAAAAAVEELLADAELRARLGEAARRDFRERFSTEARNAVLAAAYAEAAA